MNRIFSSPEHSFDEIECVAVAIRKIADQRHTGILHRDEDGSGKVCLTHLRFHHDLAVESPSDAYLWVVPDIPTRRLRHVAAWCRKVWRSNQGDVPFALSRPSGQFDDKTGEHLYGPTRLGLTCATFVLGMFDKAGLKMILDDTWPVGRDGDEAWQRKILEDLGSRATPKHVERVREDVGVARFRPEEVAGAASESPWPVSFESAVSRSIQILSRLYD